MLVWEFIPGDPQVPENVIEIVDLAKSVPPWYTLQEVRKATFSPIMNHRIIGTTLPVLELQLQPGESVLAVSGELSWMSQSIQLKTGAQFGGGGGFLGAFKRVAGGGKIAPGKRLGIP